MDNYRDDFEEFLKGKADQHKMYPSDKVWTAINRKLHPRRKWYLAGLLLLVTGIGYYTANELQSSGEIVTAQPDHPAINSSGLPNADANTRNASPSKENIAASQASAVIRNISENKINGENRPSTEPVAVIAANNHLSASGLDLSPALETEARVIPMFSATTGIQENAQPSPIQSPEAKENIENHPLNLASLQRFTAVDEEFLDRQRAEIMATQALYAFDYKKPSRFSIQYSFSPIVSYRKFSGRDNAQLHTTINTVPNALNISGKAENLVNHIPAPGLEIGAAVLYHIHPRLAVKTGLQFNYSRYDINAYRSPGEIATINLSNTGNTRKPLYGFSTHSNFGGTHSEVLQNAYFQISAPIGLEWTMLGNDKVQLGVAGSLQPAYLLNKNSYLISTDYKNYTQNPDLLRTWNLYTNAEIYAAFQTPTVRWQIGPQVRYQVISGFKKEYPIRQNLIEYGIKIGVSRPFNHLK